MSLAQHPTQIAQWKKELKEGMPEIFSSKKDPYEKQKGQLVDELYKQIGQLQGEIGWLKKKLPF